MSEEAPVDEVEAPRRHRSPLPTVDPVARTSDGKALIDAGQPEEADSDPQAGGRLLPGGFTRTSTTRTALYNLRQCALLGGRPERRSRLPREAAHFGDQTADRPADARRGARRRGRKRRAEAILMPTRTAKVPPGQAKKETAARVPTARAARAASMPNLQSGCSSDHRAMISRSGSRSASSRKTIPFGAIRSAERRQRRVAAVRHAFAVAGRPVDQEQVDAVRQRARSNRCEYHGAPDQLAAMRLERSRRSPRPLRRGSRVRSARGRRPPTPGRARRRSACPRARPRGGR